MNKQEFKELNQAFINALSKEVVKEAAEMQVLPTNPFEQGTKILINYKGISVGEVYQLENTGDYAQWKFLGNTRL